MKVAARLGVTTTGLASSVDRTAVRTVTRMFRSPALDRSPPSLKAQLTMNTRRPARAASCRVEHDLARREVHWIRRRSKASSPASSPLYFQWLFGGELAPRVGFEPTTSRLTAGCSTTELPRIVVRGHIAIAGAGASVAGGLSEASAAPPETAPPRRGSRSPRGAAASGGAADGAR